MVRLTFVVEDERADALIRHLEDDLNIKNIKVEKFFQDDVQRRSGSTATQITEILEEAKDKHLFKEIDDPSEWQRQIRGE